MVKEHKLVHDVLTDLEKNSLALVADNKTLINALRKVFLAPIYHQGVLEKGVEADPLINFALCGAKVMQGASDYEIANMLRGKVEAISLLESGFTVLNDFQTVKEDKKKEVNQAR